MLWKGNSTRDVSDGSMESEEQGRKGRAGENVYENIWLSEENLFHAGATTEEHENDTIDRVGDTHCYAAS